MEQVWHKTWYTGHDACKSCCKSCATGGTCESEKKPKEPCCGSCATGGQCEGEKVKQDRDNRQRAGLPTHRDHPELYDEKFLQAGNQGVKGEGVLAPSRYRRIYTFEKEPYFFAKEYEDDFCYRHPSPWSEGGYYYYKDAHKTKENQ